MLPLVTNFNKKLKFKTIELGKHPILNRLGVFLRKMVKNAPKFLYFCVLFIRMIRNKIIFWLTTPIFSEIPLEGNITIFFSFLPCKSHDMIGDMTFPLRPPSHMICAVQTALSYVGRGSKIQTKILSWNFVVHCLLLTIFSIKWAPVFYANSGLFRYCLRVANCIFILCIHF